MQYSTALILSVLAAGAVGGAASFIDHGGDTQTVRAAFGGARSNFRETMRELDGAYYKRGDAYSACAASYGVRAANARTNGEITLSCECFDKSLRLLGGHDRETALMALGPDPDSPASGKRFAITATAGRVLRNCDIEPWTGGDIAQDGIPGELRGSL